MKNADQVVDKVLKGLREAEAPEGMERRVLLAMERRAATPVSTGWQALWKSATVHAGVACASLLCAVLWMDKPHRSAPRTRVEELAAARSATAQAVATTGLPPQIMPPRLGRSKILQVTALDDSDTLAFEETRAPSHPAPPLPPTEQERLLTQVASRHDPEQVAVLNPEIRAQQELQAKVEFHDFFEPVRPAQESPTTKINVSKGETQ